MIKNGTPGYCKEEVKDKLKGDDIPRGEHVAAVTNLNGVKMIALACCENMIMAGRQRPIKLTLLAIFWQQTVSQHYQVSQQRRNDKMQMGKEIHKSLSTVASLQNNTMMVCQLLI